MRFLEGNVNRKQEDKYKHEARPGRNRMYLLKVVLYKENLFDYMDKDVVFSKFSVQSVPHC